MIHKALVAASLKPVLLSLLAHGETYGYDLIQRIERLSGGDFQVAAGTVYPVLHKLETEGLIESTWHPSESGPRRKYYALTPAGEAALEREKRQWLSVHGLLLKLWGPEPALS